MKTNKFLFITLLIITSCSNDQSCDTDNEVDLSQYPDYQLIYSVNSSGLFDSFEYDTTFITTDENDEIIEETFTTSGINMGDSHVTGNHKFIKGYKNVGIRITAISDNIQISWVNIRDTIIYEPILEYHTIPVNIYTQVNYDFESNAETIISE